MTSTAFGTPALNLKVRRVVSEMSELFRLSRFGDVQGVQTLFSAQEASPDDVNPIGGWTVLHVSLGPLSLMRATMSSGIRLRPPGRAVVRSDGSKVNTSHSLQSITVASTFADSLFNRALILTGKTARECTLCSGCEA